MKINAEESDRMIDIVRNEIALYEQIYEISVQLKKALAADNLDDITGCVKQQDARSEELRLLEEKRLDQLRDLYGTGELPRLSQVCRDISGDRRETLERLTEKLKDLLRRNRSISVENELMIKSRLGNVKKDIELIAGFNKEDSGYGHNRKKQSTKRNIVNRKA
ncbi:MAG: flagellar export chaperone FlgN [Fibrobacterota bacterium]